MNLPELLADRKKKRHSNPKHSLQWLHPNVCGARRNNKQKMRENISITEKQTNNNNNELSHTNLRIFITPDLSICYHRLHVLGKEIISHSKADQQRRRRTSVSCGPHQVGSSFSDWKTCPNYANASGIIQINLEVRMGS